MLTRFQTAPSQRLVWSQDDRVGTVTIDFRKAVSPAALFAEEKASAHITIITRDGPQAGRTGIATQQGQRHIWMCEVETSTGAGRRPRKSPVLQVNFKHRPGWHVFDVCERDAPVMLFMTFMTHESEDLTCAFATYRGAPALGVTSDPSSSRRRLPGTPFGGAPARRPPQPRAPLRPLPGRPFCGAACGSCTNGAQMSRLDPCESAFCSTLTPRWKTSNCHRQHALQSVHRRMQKPAKACDHC